jgi:hypothetical protein
MTACGAQLAAFANGDVFIFLMGGMGSLQMDTYIHSCVLLTILVVCLPIVVPSMSHHAI